MKAKMLNQDKRELSVGTPKVESEERGLNYISSFEHKKYLNNPSHVSIRFLTVVLVQLQ